MMTKGKAKNTITIPGTKVKLPQWAAYLAGGGVLAALFLMKGQPHEEDELSTSEGWLAEEVAQRFAEERNIYAGALEDISGRINELGERPKKTIATPKPGQSYGRLYPVPKTKAPWDLGVTGSVPFVEMDDVAISTADAKDLPKEIAKRPGWEAVAARLTGAAEAYAAGTYGKPPTTIKPSAPEPNMNTTTNRSDATAARSAASIKAETARLQGQADKYLKSGYKPKTSKPVTQKSKRSVATTSRLQAKYNAEKAARLAKLIQKKEAAFVPPSWY